MPPIAAIIAVLSVAPQLVVGWKDLMIAINTFHAAGLLESTDEQIAAMLASGAKLDADIVALQTAAGPRPTAGA